MSKLKQVVIALRLEGVIGRRILTGILRYLDSTANWDIRFAYGVQELLRMAPTADGILVDHLSESLENDLATAAPVVHFNVKPLPATNHRHAFVHVDDGAIGLAAAKYLLSLSSFRSFGFVPAHGDRFWSRRRGDAYALHLRQNKRAVNEFTTDATGGGNDIDRLIEWIQGLPKPAALFVAWDGRAVEVLEACRKARIQVPKQVVVLGVDNDEILCERTSPPLSSIAPDAESEGFEGARLLDGLMQNRPQARKRIILGSVRKIVERVSTRPPPPAVQLIQRAVDFIESEACRGIRPDDVAQRLSVSRSLLDLRFREFQGTSVGDFIRTTRLRALARLLRSSRRPIAELTQECGFSSVNSAKEMFRRDYQMSMRDYRRGKDTPPGDPLPRRKACSSHTPDGRANSQV